ncbi:MAG: CPBP family intramembrane metalloprotease [Bacteroidales bacterium]|nr:CPBP family intramembrane metalloprotease [Bacteroidales bacterium]
MKRSKRMVIHTHEDDYKCEFHLTNENKYKQMKMKYKNLRVTLITFVGFILFYILYEYFFKDINGFFRTIFLDELAFVLTYLIVAIPMFVAVGLNVKFKNIISSLGLNTNMPNAFFLSLFFTVPMFIGYAFVFDFNAEITMSSLFVSSVCAGFFEELYYRGYLFGQLYRNTKLGFIPSVIVGAIIFGLLHLYQGNDFLSSLSVFLVTFAGGVMFAWLYAEWRFNIWVPVFLHMLMNMSWMLFSAAETAAGNMYANIFRFITIALAISFTIFYKLKSGYKLEINRRTLIIKRDQEKA